jgi:hypothetical protein
MVRGRPSFSEVRQNIVEIIAVLKSGYGYEIYSIYRSVFQPASLRLIYYHLKRGASLGELRVQKVQKEKGDYSWGPEAEKIYYALGPEAKVKGDARVQKYLEKRKK